MVTGRLSRSGAAQYTAIRKAVPSDHEIISDYRTRPCRTKKNISGIDRTIKVQSCGLFCTTVAPSCCYAANLAAILNWQRFCL